MTLRSLTVKEKILLHLFDFTRFVDAYEAPEDVTQEGISRAVGIRVHHVNQYVTPLIAEGFAEERTGHVVQRARRRKLYFLTSKGRAEVAVLRGVLLAEPVPVRRKDGGQSSVPLSHMYQEDRRGTSLLALLAELAANGSIAQEPSAPAPRFVDFTDEAVKLERFHGRDAEVELLHRGLAEKPMVVVTGMAGMGKTSLASRVCEAFQGERSRFWREIRPWDTGMDLSLRLAGFLKSLGRSELHGVLAGSSAKELGQVEEPMRADLDGLPALLVFDDAHQASGDAQTFLAILLKVLSSLKGPSALVLSRATPTFYSRREVAIDAAVLEVPLQGLDARSSIALLADMGVTDPLAGSFVDACGGIPLFLELVGHAGSRGMPDEGWRTLETYIAEQIDPSLEADERACLRTGAFYYVPVPPEGLSLTGDVSRRTLANLNRKGLLTAADGGRYTIHDAIRSYFEGTLSGQEKSSLAVRVVDWLTGQATDAAAGGRLPEAIAFMGNAVAIDVDPARRVAGLNQLGEYRRHTGDYPGAIDAYQAALRDETDAAATARLRQKVALCLENLGRLEDAQREVLEGLSRIPNTPSLEAAWLIEQQASIAYERQDYSKAIEDIERVTEWMAGLPRDAELWGHLANVRGLIHLYDPSRFDPALAEADFLEAVEAWREAAYKRGLCLVYNNLFLAALNMGRPEERLPFLDDSAGLAREIGDVPALETALFTKAWYLTEWRGDFAAAEPLYRETYRLAKETHRRSKVVWHYYHFANLYRRQGRFEEARESLQYFLDSSVSILNMENRVEYLSLMARLCLDCGDPEGAQVHHREAERMAASSESEFAASLVGWTAARLLAGRGDPIATEAAFQRAEKARWSGDRSEFLLDYGRFLASVGATDHAKELISNALRENRATDSPIAAALKQALRALESGHAPRR